MEKNNLWKAFFLILSALLGFGASEVVDDKIVVPILEKPAEPIPECPEAIVIAYTDNGKFFCECVGAECPCESTEEILSKLG